MIKTLPQTAVNGSGSRFPGASSSPFPFRGSIGTVSGRLEANSAVLGALRILTTRWPPMTISGICSLPTAEC